VRQRRKKPVAETTIVQRGPEAKAAAAGALSGAPIAELNLDRAVTLVGREGADLCLDSPVVSRVHAAFRRRAGGGHSIEDLRSMNGTFVGASRVQHQVLREGDVVLIGPYEIVYRGRTASVHDLRGALRVDARQLGRRVRGDRWILRDVSLSVMPREFIALVGGSGAGKSTLMRLLSAQVSPTTGLVQYNGDDAHGSFERYRAIVGYVPQDDILHRELPVRRALGYAAHLRLPPDTTAEERARRIDRALDEVEMREHADKRICDLSGGQRKRVSIAAELLADPALFFLDEPTSGLDPGLEGEIYAGEGGTCKADTDCVLGPCTNGVCEVLDEVLGTGGSAGDGGAGGSPGGGGAGETTGTGGDGQAPPAAVEKHDGWTCGMAGGSGAKPPLGVGAALLLGVARRVRRRRGR